MPRRVRADKLAERRERAIHRGFLKPTHGNEFIEVDRRVASATRTMAESLKVHLEHDEAVGYPHHHARLASRQALVDGHISEQEAASATQLHRKADRAKHGVSQSSRT